MLRFLLKVLLTLSVFSLALAVLGSGFGVVEISVWTGLLVLVLWFVCRGDIRAMSEGLRRRRAPRR